jgi:hypothetical protein
MQYNLRVTYAASASSRPEALNPRSDDSIMKTTPETSSHDWSRFDAMTEDERHAAALKDPDAQPLTLERLASMKRTPQVRVIRRAFARLGCRRGMR